MNPSSQVEEFLKCKFSLYSFTQGEFEAVCMPPAHIVAERVGDDNDCVGIRLRVLPRKISDDDNKVLSKVAAAYTAAGEQAMADLVNEACRVMAPPLTVPKPAEEGVDGNTGPVGSA